MVNEEHGAGVQGAVVSRLLAGDWKSGDRVDPHRLAGRLGVPVRHVTATLATLVDEGLLTRSPDGGFAAKPAPVHASKRGELTAEVTRRLRHWIAVGVLPRDTVLSVDLTRILGASTSAISSALVHLAGADELRYGGWGFMQPGARGVIDQAIEAVDAILAGTPAGTRLNASVIADELNHLPTGMVKSALAHAWGQGRVYPIAPNGSGRMEYYVNGTIPSGERVRMEATTRATRVEAVSAWLRQARLAPAEPIRIFRLATDLRVPVPAVGEALACLLGRGGMVAHTGIAYVMGGPGIGPRADAIPPILRSVAGIVAPLPLNSSIHVSAVQAQVPFKRTPVRFAFEWLVGAGVLKRRGPTHVVVARPDKRWLPSAAPVADALRTELDNGE